MSTRSLLFALLSAPLLALAQNTNPFKIPDSGLSATAGQALNLQWNPTTQGTITLILRSGNSSDLAAGTVIAQSISNSGSYSWTPSESITRGSDYTVEIVDDNDASNTNYTPYFVLDSDTLVAYSTSQVTLGAPSATLAASTASPKGSAASFFSTVSTTAVASHSVAASSTVAASSSSLASSAGSIPSSTASGSSAIAASTSAVSSGSSSAMSMSAGSRSSNMATSTVSSNMATSTVAGTSSMSLASSSASASSTTVADSQTSGASAYGAPAIFAMFLLVVIGALVL